MERSEIAPSPGGSNPMTTVAQADSASFQEVVHRLTGQISNASKMKVVNSAKQTPPRPPIHERRKYSSPKIEIAPAPALQQESLMQQYLNETGQTLGSMATFLHPLQCCWNSISPQSFNPASLQLPSPTSYGIQGSGVCVSSSTSYSRKRGSPSPRERMNIDEEDKAIKERRFYLHQSPRSSPENGKSFSYPELLNLFPLTSPMKST